MNNASSTDGMVRPDHDAISVVELMNTLLRRRRWIIAFALGLALLVGTWSVTRQREYIASASFIPRAGDTMAGGAYSIARQFGINVGTESSAYSSAFYAQLIRSRRIVRAVLITPFGVVNGSDQSRTLIEYYGVGEMPTDLMWLEAERRLRESVSVTVTAETGVVEIRTITPNPELAELITARILALVSQFNLETRRQQGLEETRFIADRLQQVTDSLQAAEQALMSFLERNRYFEAPALAFENDRLQRRVAHQQALYSSLVESLEQARLEAARDLPVVTVINEPEGSAVPRSRGTVVKTMAALIAGLILAAFGAFVFEYFGRATRTEGPAAREFRTLRQEAFRDLRNPLRAVSPAMRRRG